MQPTRRVPLFLALLLALHLPPSPTHCTHINEWKCDAWNGLAREGGRREATASGPTEWRSSGDWTSHDSSLKNRKYSFYPPSDHVFQLATAS